MHATALGGLGWAPGAFWDATPHDYFAALEYHERAAVARDDD